MSKNGGWLCFFGLGVMIVIAIYVGAKQYNLANRTNYRFENLPEFNIIRAKVEKNGRKLAFVYDKKDVLISGGPGVPGVSVQLIETGFEDGHTTTIAFFEMGVMPKYSFAKDLVTGKWITYEEWWEKNRVGWESL